MKTMDLMYRNRKKEIDESANFRWHFGRNLHDYMNYITGKEGDKL